jgi:predicted nuclease of predicted toxin-antitoxin system
MRLLLDMNVSPQLVSALAARGHDCAHWSTLGDPRASDEIILRYAKENGFVLITHGLDFGAILATSQADARVSSKFACRTSYLSALSQPSWWGSSVSLKNFKAVP